MARKKDENVIEEFLNFEELAKKTGLTVSFLKKAKAHYGLPHYKIGALVRFKLSEINLWLQQRKVAG